MTSALSPSTRRDALAAATTGTHDLVVVGGGVTGAGVALDAAARGLSVVLLEAGDLAVGTSSRSGKTMHGGLRYLEQLNFSLVFGALRERDLTIRTLAPHLVSHEPFLYPLTKQWEKPYVGAGVGLYDAMSTMSRRIGGAPHARYLGRRALHREAPGLADSVIGGLQYPDGRMDDARHTLAVARTAAAYGAQVVPYARVAGVHTDAGGRATGVHAEDVLGGGEFDVSARVVVNAAGVWAAEVQQMAGARTFSVAPAKGVHVLLRPEAFESRTGILTRAEDSVIVLRKWYGYWLLGTTDTPYTGDLRNPTADKEDIEYLLRNVNRLLRRPIRRDDLLGTFAGLRPLLAPAGDAAGTTSALSRDHAVMEAPAGMVTIVGGKYTTYRIMARDAVDAAGKSLGRSLPDSLTETLPLVGAPGWRVIANQFAALSARYGVPEATLERMLHRYGDELPDVLAPAADDPTLAVPVDGAAGYLPVEFLRAVTHEGAANLDDVLTRRTHVAIEETDAGTGAATRIAALIAPALGWDAVRQKDEVASYDARPRLATVL
ncbi:glycerol-3-phosphate dehydrogenase/oxidase [Geodermatophilus sp. SYSU D00742]